MANNYPIILAHGIARFDVLTNALKKHLGVWLGAENAFFRFLEVLGVNSERLQFLKSISLSQGGLDYFKEMVGFLKDKGFEAIATDVAFADQVEIRAEQLKTQVKSILQKTNAPKVHIISHSMGGLDARYMIAKLEMADKVASLTTIGTPHKGTSLAQPLLDDGGNSLIELFHVIGLTLEGFKDLTINECNKRNKELIRAEVENQVVYQTYASYEEQAEVFAPLQKAWEIIYKAAGRNDGLVEYTSQQWESVLVHPDDSTKTKKVNQFEFPIRADHLNEVGWWDLNELKDPNSWSMDVISTAMEYEAKIRNVYLDIAKGVSNLKSS
jgi:triacylglycerol lipase